MSRKESTFHIAREPYPTRRFLSWPKRSVLANAAEDSHFFFWARNAIYHSLKMFGVARGEEVLVPAYVCRAAVEPIEAFGARAQFYDVDRHCRVNFSDIEGRIRSNTKVLLAAHYFGFPQDIERLRALCDRHNLRLIEDCAHVLVGDVNRRRLGSYGDVGIFSYRKFLPMNDGAELRINRSDIHFQVDFSATPYAFQLKAAKSLIDRALDESPGMLARGASSLLDNVKKMLRPTPARIEANSAMAVDQYGASFEKALLNSPITSLSGWMLRHSDIAAVVRQRRDNFLLLNSLLARISNVTSLVSVLSEGFCPWVYPAIFSDVPDALAKLRNSGVPAVSWNGVRPVGVTRENFPDADFLYENLLFLPIHQNLTADDMRLVASTVERIANKT